MRALHHLASKASLFQQLKDYNSITMAIPSFQLSLAWKREPQAGYIQNTGHLAHGGRKSQGDTSNQLKESPLMPDLCLADPDLSLTECNCKSKS